MRKEGFTLIEVLMAIVLLGIIGTVVSFLFYQGVKSFDSLDKRNDLTEEGTLAVTRMEKELSLIRCTVSGASCVPQSSDITNMTPTELRFVKTDNSGRGIRLNSTDLMLREGSGASDPEDVLAKNVSSLSFEYLKKDGTTAAAATEVWVINATLTLSNGTESVTFKAGVHPRTFR